MVSQVVQFKVEDHVSSLLQAVDDMHILIDVDAQLPLLPALTVNVESRSGPLVSIRMTPSPELLSWIADVKRMSVKPIVSDGFPYS